MKKILITSIFALFFVLVSTAQMTASEVDQHRKEHLTSLTDTASHGLNLKEIEEFGGLDYYDFDAKYQMNVTFTRDKGKKFEMPTSTERKPAYRRYGYVHFTVDSVEYQLTVYQQIDYKEFLFIPFRDLTSRTETYGGGRYLDFPKMKKGSTVLDFNLAYNPYCAYSYRYSCPIPPKENTLSIQIKAGEKIPLAH